MRRPILAALCLAAIVPPALAQDRPIFVPTRDVAVTYRVTGGQAAGQEVRMAWLTAARRLRVDMPGGAGWSVVDQAAGRVLVVLDQQRLVMEVPAQTGPQDGSGGGPRGGPGDGPRGLSLPAQPPASARFTRGGAERVAGQSCTLWRYEDGAVRGETCITADGVMLRSRGSQGERSGAVEAVAVAYGAQDPAQFQPPLGYRAVQLPPGLVPPAPAPPGGAQPGDRPGR